MAQIIDWTIETEDTGTVVEGEPNTALLSVGDGVEAFASVISNDTMVEDITYTIRFTVSHLVGSVYLYSYGGWWEEGEEEITSNGTYAITRTVAPGGDNIPFGFYVYGQSEEEGGCSAQISNVTIEHMEGESFYAPDLPPDFYMWTPHTENGGTATVGDGGNGYLQSRNTQWGLAMFWHLVDVPDGLRCIARFTVDILTGTQNRISFTTGPDWPSIGDCGNVRYLTMGDNAQIQVPTHASTGRHYLTFTAENSYYGAESVNIQGNVTLEREDGQPWVAGTVVLDPVVAPTFVWYGASSIIIDVLSPIPDSVNVPLNAELVFRVHSADIVDLANVNAWIVSSSTVPIILAGTFANAWTGEIITVTEDHDYIFALIRPLGNPKFESGTMTQFTIEYEEL